MFDILIIGAGITGCMLAKDLSKYNFHVALVDKESDIAEGATNANSAIVHTGYDPEDGTLKAQLNVRGAQMYEQLCKDLGAQYKTIGAYVVASGEEEENHLDILAERAKRRGIPYRELNHESLMENEPNCNPNLTRALDFYTTAIIYPWQVALGCATVAVNNGTKLYLNEEVKSIDTLDDEFVVHTTNQILHTKTIINASGIGVEKIDRMVSDDIQYHITPRKGEYFVFDQGVDFVRHIIFPVPGKKGKGVLAVPTVYGNILVGPNAEMVETEDVDTTKEGLSFIRQEITKTVQNVPYGSVIRTFAGLRPSSTNHDFIIEEREDVPNFIDVASIESPGLASAPAISEYVIEKMLKQKLTFTLREDYVWKPCNTFEMTKLTVDERNQKIHENPKYGKIVCRCENISEGEIIDCIHDTIGATTVKGVKKRVRPGMGRCQGGFCEPLVLDILAREFNIDRTKIVLDKDGSFIVREENR